MTCPKGVRSASGSRDGDRAAGCAVLVELLDRGEGDRIAPPHVGKRLARTDTDRPETI